MNISYDHVWKRYGKKVALKDCTLSLSSGITALLGPNGAGKTTLMNLTAGVLNLSQGEILYNEKDISKLGSAYRSSLGYLPQQPDFYDNYSGGEIIRYFSGLKGISLAKNEEMNILEQVHLKEDAARKCKGYSGGMKRRLGIAVALLGNPEIIILDEPTAGLDPMERISLKQLIKELGQDRIILYSTHIVSDIEEIADQVIIIKDGQVIDTKTINEWITFSEQQRLELNASFREIQCLDDVYMWYFGEKNERDNQE